MRDYDYSEKWKKLPAPEMVAMLTQIHEQSDIFSTWENPVIEERYGKKRVSIVLQFALLSIIIACERR